MSFPNHYTHRRVAEANARGCEICFKPSTSVLVAVENKDFFYVCASHLKDRGFCTPKIDEAAVEARKKKALEEEIARVKQEYEEKQRKKKEKEKGKEDAKNEKDGNGKDKPEADSSKDDKKEKADSESKSKIGSPPPEEEEPRVFELKNTFYQQRVSRKRQAETVKRNRERMQDPNFFPSVPKGAP